MSRVLRKNQVIFWSTLMLFVPMAVILGCALCLRTLYWPHFSVALREVPSETASHTWNSEEQNEDIFVWLEEYDKVFLLVVSFFYMAFDPNFRWFQDLIVPRNPDNLESLQLAECAEANDLAVASFSLRGFKSALAPGISFSGFHCWPQFEWS